MMRNIIAALVLLLPFGVMAQTNYLNAEVVLFSNAVFTGAITLNGGALTVSNNTLKLNGAAVTSGLSTNDMLALLWTNGNTNWQTQAAAQTYSNFAAASFLPIGSTNTFSGPGLSVSGLAVTLSTNGWNFGSGGLSTNDMLALMWANGGTNWATIAQLTGATNTTTLGANGVLWNGDWGGSSDGAIPFRNAAGGSAGYVSFSSVARADDTSIYVTGGGTLSAGGFTGNGSGLTGLVYATSSGYSTNAGAVGGVAVGGLVQTNDTRYLATLTNGLSSFLVGGTNLLVQSSAVDYRNKLTMNFGGLEAQYGGLWVGTNTITAQNYFLLWSAADSYVGNAPAVYFNSPGTTGILRLRQNNQDKIVLSNAQVYIPATLNTALINGNGSGISNVNAATLGGVALGGLVQTQELNSASNTLAAATALKANSNSVVTVVQTNSSGVAVTNQFTVGVANPTITLPTISAGGAITTNDILSVTVVRNSTQTYSNAFVRANHNVISSGASNLYSVADGSFSMPYDGAVQVGVQETAAFISGQQHITAIYTNNTLLARLSFWYPNNSLTQITAPYWSRPHYLTSGTTVQVYLFNQTAVTITGQADSVTTPAWISFTAIRGNQYQ